MKKLFSISKKTAVTAIFTWALINSIILFGQLKADQLDWERAQNNTIIITQNHPLF